MALILACTICCRISWCFGARSWHWCFVWHVGFVWWKRRTCQNILFSRTKLIFLAEIQFKFEFSFLQEINFYCILFLSFYSWVYLSIKNTMTKIYTKNTHCRNGPYTFNVYFRLSYTFWSIFFRVLAINPYAQNTH